MCGIAGFLASQSAADGFLREPVARMCERMVHRGPDMHGYAVDGPVCLGHRRLSIIDLSPEGAQPMANEDGSVQIVVNGEIYNFSDLRAELEGKGHRFRSHSDSEVALHLYEELGTKFLGRLRGMFALALWDRKQRRLLLARDPVGKKPLFYYQGPQGLLFASEVQALVGSDCVPREPDLDAIDAYLGLQYVPSPLCAFRGVRKLPPGSFALCTPGQEPTVERYHRLDFHPDPALPRDRGRSLGRAAPAIAGGRAPAHGGGRSLGRVPFRWTRFVAGRGPDGRIVQPSGEDFFGRVSRAGSERAALREAGRATLWHRSP
jgi:asparagine synthase (glutamine-hydrolysing)